MSIINRSMINMKARHSPLFWKFSSLIYFENKDSRVAHCFISSLVLLAPLHYHTPFLPRIILDPPAQLSPLVMVSLRIPPPPTPFVGTLFTLFSHCGSDVSKSSHLSTPLKFASTFSCGKTKSFSVDPRQHNRTNLPES